MYRKEYIIVKVEQDWYIILVLNSTMFLYQAVFQRCLKALEQTLVNCSSVNLQECSVEVAVLVIAYALENIIHKNKKRQ